MSSPLIRSGCSWRNGLALFASLFAVVSFASAQTSDPAIISQPAGGVTVLGEDWGFDVAVSGTAPFFYQWFQSDAAIPGATNSYYTIGTVTNNSAGTYTVAVSNSVGRAVSNPATLTLSPTPPRTIRNGSITVTDKVRVPIVFSGNGREQIIRFSLSYDTNVLANPGWEDPGTNPITGTNGWRLDLSQTSSGQVGFDITRAGNYPPSSHVVGSVTFDLSNTNDPFAAMLQFTNTPVTLEAVSTNFVSLGLWSGIVPQVDLDDATPILNRQSGLMEQWLSIRYAGSIVITNVDIAVGNLGTDSLTNSVKLYNRIGIKPIDTTGYGDVLQLPFASAGMIIPADNKPLTMEYYVSDKFTVPQPEYYLDLGTAKIFRLPNAATPLDITRQKYLEGTFVIQFPTVANYLYYVQYAESVADLINFGPTSAIVDPPVTGTGHSVQWIDNGPPKTVSLPTEGMRFYRVIELPVN